MRLRWYTAGLARAEEKFRASRASAISPIWLEPYSAKSTDQLLIPIANPINTVLEAASLISSVVGARPTRIRAYPICTRLDQQAQVTAVANLQRCPSGRDTAAVTRIFVARVADATAASLHSAKLLGVCFTSEFPPTGPREGVRPDWNHFGRYRFT
jgi:hypothetical protein